MASTPSTLALNIKQRMRDLNITSNLALSKMSGVSRAVITNVMLHPEKSIMADSALQLSKTLNCRVEWLLTGKGHITIDEAIYNNGIHLGSPIFTLNQISEAGIEVLLQESFENPNRNRMPCPTGNKPSIFAVWQNRPMGKINHAGHIYFDKDKKPVSGQLVIARTSPNAPLEYMEFYSAHDKQFLRTVEEHIPEDLRMIELANEMEIIATFECFVVV